METIKELPEKLENELIELKDSCWGVDETLNGKNIYTYRSKVEEFHKEGYNVGVFLSVANNLEKKVKGDNGHKGVTIKNEKDIIDEKKNINGAETIKGYGLMLPQGNQMGFRIYLGRNIMDKSEIIELWICEKTGRCIETKYTCETEDMAYRKLFNQRDRALRVRGL